MNLCPSNHIGAQKDEIAKVVLMPGDPKRATYIAQTYLENPKLVNEIRGALAYTGTYRGERVTVMASGMGIPSIGIYSYELYNNYDVDAIIRVGSAGALRDETHVRDIIIGMGASTDSSFADQFALLGRIAPLADYELLELAVNACRAKGARYHVGNILSSDAFYSSIPNVNERWRDMGVLAVEMEAAGLYLNAVKAGKKALAICTVSNHIFTMEDLTAKDREIGFGEMIEVALETAVGFLKQEKKA